MLVALILHDSKVKPDVPVDSVIGNSTFVRVHNFTFYSLRKINKIFLKIN